VDWTELLQDCTSRLYDYVDLFSTTICGRSVGRGSNMEDRLRSRRRRVLRVPSGHGRPVPRQAL